MTDDLERRMAAFTGAGDARPILDPEVTGLLRGPAGPGVVARLRWYRYLAAPGTDPVTEVAAALGHLRTWGAADPEAALAALPPLPGLPGAWQAHLRGGILLQQGTAGGDDAVLDRGLDELRAALAATPADHPNRQAILSDLGGGLRSRYERQGAGGDLDEAIRLSEESVALAPADSPYRAAQQINLHSALLRRFERDSQRTDLDAALSHGREAVAAITDPADRAVALANLGVTLRVSLSATGREADGLEAIRVGEEAVALTSPDNPRHATHLSDLSASLREWAATTGDPAGLDRAVDVGRRAVTAARDGNPDRALCLSNLGLALHTRHRRLGAREDRDEAVRLVREAVRTAAPGDPHRPLLIGNLGLVLESLDSLVDAVEQLPPGHVATASSRVSLGESYRVRFGRTGDRRDIEEAVRLGEQAVRTAPADDPSRPGMLSSLALALRDRAATRTWRGLSDLLEASRLAAQAIDLTPDEAPEAAQLRINFAAVFAARHERTHRRRYAVTAVEQLRAAADVAAAPASIRLRGARTAAELAAELSAWAAAAASAATAVELVPLVAWRGLGRSAREDWLAETAGLASDAAALAIEAGCPADAVALADQARAVLWTQLLDTRTELAALSAADPAAARRLGRLRAALNSAETPTAPTPDATTAESSSPT